MISTFYIEAFREIDEVFGFDLTQLDCVKAVISDSQMGKWRTQIMRLKQICTQVGYKIPALGVMTHFYSMLKNLQRKIAQGSGSFVKPQTAKPLPPIVHEQGNESFDLDEDDGGGHFKTQPSQCADEST